MLFSLTSSDSEYWWNIEGDTKYLFFEILFKLTWRKPDSVFEGSRADQLLKVTKVGENDK